MLHYAGTTGRAAVFLSVYAAIVSVLISGFTPTDVLWTMQAVNVPIIVFAKVIHISIFFYKYGSICMLVFNIHVFGKRSLFFKDLH